MENVVEKGNVKKWRARILKYLFNCLFTHLAKKALFEKLFFSFEVVVVV